MGRETEMFRAPVKSMVLRDGMAPTRLKGPLRSVRSTNVESSRPYVWMMLRAKLAQSKVAGSDNTEVMIWRCKYPSHLRIHPRFSRTT